MNREELMENVSGLLIKHILSAELYVNPPSQGASLFKESNFKRQEWQIQTTGGFSSTMPLFIYSYDKIVDPVHPCSKNEIFMFYRKIFDIMQLATECIVVSLIYIERLMTSSRVEIRFCNWKPIVFTSILLASKFWEDICFWNIDYA